MSRWIDAELSDPTVRRGMDVIAEVVRRGRRNAGVSQQRLASMADLNQSSISRLERAELRSMRLVRLARVIGAIVDMGGLAQPERQSKRGRSA